MSISSRARHLSAVAGMTYQNAVNTIRGLGAGPAALVAETSWPLKRADVFLVNADLDTEYSAAWKNGARYVNRESCENCAMTYFIGLDKKGMHIFGSDRYCPDCVSDHGTDNCPSCGCEVLGELEGPCSDCWSKLMTQD